MGTCTEGGQQVLSGLVTCETLYLVWSLGRRLILFGHSGDALSGLVTRETLGLVWSLGRRLVWFGHSGDAWSGLVTRETLSDLTHSGDAMCRWQHSGDVIRPWPGYPMFFFRWDICWSTKGRNLSPATNVTPLVQHWATFSDIRRLTTQIARETTFRIQMT